MNAFDVRIYTIRRRKNKRRPFEVRWRVAGRDRSKSFLTRALADSYRAELIRAARQGLEFDPATGEPVRWAVPAPPVTTWLEHAVAYADMKWPHLAPHSRASLADALATLTPALATPAAGRPAARTLHAALYRHVFNPTRRAAATDPAMARALGWLARASLPITQLSHPQVTRAALDALTVRLDGDRAAATTVARKRAVFHDTLGYAVELGLLHANPLGQVRWTAPAAATAVNLQAVASPAQVRAILAVVRRLRPELAAFFGCLYYAALRPEEAVALRQADLVLPHTGGESWSSPERARAPARRGPAPGRRTSFAVSSTARTGRSASSRSRRPWLPCCGSTCGSTGRRRTGGCSAAPAAACSVNRSTAVSGMPPAASRSARTWPPRRWPAAHMTCGMPPCPCG
jgi:hypothetical protein